MDDRIVLVDWLWAAACLVVVCVLSCEPFCLDIGTCACVLAAAGALAASPLVCIACSRIPFVGEYIPGCKI